MNVINRFYVRGLTSDMSWNENTRYQADQSPISGQVVTSNIHMWYSSELISNKKNHSLSRDALHCVIRGMRHASMTRFHDYVTLVRTGEDEIQGGSLRQIPTYSTQI